MVTDGVESTPVKNNDCKNKTEITKDTPRWNCLTNSSTKINELLCCEKVGHSVLFYVFLVLILLIFVYIIRKLVSSPIGSSKYSNRKLTNNTDVTVRNESSGSLGKTRPIKWPEIHKIVAHLEANSPRVPDEQKQSSLTDHVTQSPISSLHQTTTSTIPREKVDNNLSPGYASYRPQKHPIDPRNNAIFTKSFIPETATATEAPNTGITDASGDLLKSWYPGDFGNDASFQNSPTTFPTPQHTAGENSGFENIYKDWNHQNAFRSDTNNFAWTYSGLRNPQSRPSVWGSASYSGSHVPQKSRPDFNQGRDNPQYQYQNFKTQTSLNNGQKDYNNSPWSTFGSGWPTENGFGWIRSDGQDSMASYPTYSSGSSENRLSFDDASGTWSFSENNAGGSSNSDIHQYAQPNYASYHGTNSWNSNYNYGKNNETYNRNNKLVSTSDHSGNRISTEYNENLKEREYLDNLKSWAVDNNNNHRKVHQGSVKTKNKKIHHTIYKWPSHYDPRHGHSPKRKYSEEKKLETGKRKHQSNKAGIIKKSTIPHHAAKKSRAKLGRLIESQFTSAPPKRHLTHMKRRKKLSRHKAKHHPHLNYDSYMKLKERHEEMVGKWKRKIHRVTKCKTLSSFTKQEKVTIRSRYFNKKYKYTVLSCRNVDNIHNNKDYRRNKKYKRHKRGTNQICRESWFITTGKIILKKVSGDHNVDRYTLQLCNRNYIDVSNQADSHKNNAIHKNDDDKGAFVESKHSEGNDNDGDEDTDNDSNYDDLDLDTKGDEDITSSEKDTKHSNSHNVNDMDNDDLDLENDHDERNNNKDDEDEHDDDDDDDDGDDDDDNDNDKDKDNAGKNQESNIKLRKNHDSISNINQDDNTKTRKANKDNTDDSDDNNDDGNDNDITDDDNNNKHNANDDGSNLSKHQSNSKKDNSDDNEEGDQEENYKTTNKNIQRKSRPKHKKHKSNKHKTHKKLTNHRLKKRVHKHMTKAKTKHQLVQNNDKTDSNDNVYKAVFEELIKNNKLDKDGNGDLMKVIAALNHKKPTVNASSKKHNTYPEKQIQKNVSRKKKTKRKKSKTRSNRPFIAAQTGIQLSRTQNMNVDNALKNLYNTRNLETILETSKKQSHAPPRKNSQPHVAKPVALDLKSLLKKFLPSAVLKESTAVVPTTPAPTALPTKHIKPKEKFPPTKGGSLTPENLLKLLNKIGINVTPNLKNPEEKQSLQRKESQETKIYTPKISSLLTNPTKNPPSDPNLLMQRGTFDKPHLNKKLQEFGKILTDESLRSYIPKPIKPTISPTVGTIPRPSDAPSVYVNQNTVSKPNSPSSNRYTSYSRYPTTNSNLNTYSAPPINILCFGDSLTSGYYNHGEGKHPYSIRLNQILNPDGKHRFNIVTRGLIGEMAHGSMTKRLPKVLSEGTHFDWVLILGGTNDVAHVKNYGDDDDFTQQLISVWSPKIVKDIKKLHETARSYGARTVLMTIPETAYEFWPELRAIRNMRLSVNAALRTYAAQVKDTTVLCDLAIKLPRSTLSKELQKMYWNDHIHLNPVGYNKMAEVIGRCIQPYLTK